VVIVIPVYQKSRFRASLTLPLGGFFSTHLATSLKQLLDADRQLLLVEQLGGVARACDFGDLQNQERQAAKLLYVYFYGEEAPENEEWRGPPTPRPLGVCPGG